jgi:hypothetical protein
MGKIFLTAEEPRVADGCNQKIKPQMHTDSLGVANGHIQKYEPPIFMDQTRMNKTIY